MNKLIAIALIMLIFPVLIFVALFVILSDGYPFLFTQKKYGLNNKVFNLYKFRTMKENTPLKATEDFDNANNFIIKGGYFLRKFSLDELPQLFNVINGDMNFIGPRPSLIDNEEIIYKLRNEQGLHKIKPGITGWAQVNGRDLNTFEKKVSLDYYYMRNKSLLLDIKIIFMTFKVIFLTKLVKHWTKFFMIKSKSIFSTNPNTNEKYLVPSSIDDKNNIDDFLNENAGKKVVVVQGLGFVGAVMSIVCANSIKEEYAVIGVDLPNKENYWKIKSINDGIFPLTADDKKIDEFFKKSIYKKNFYATFDPYAYSKADTIIVDINLDVKKKVDKNNILIDYEVNLSSFENAISSIGEHCNENTLILVETTVPPGTCMKVIKPIIEKKFIERKFNIKKIKIGHSYERVMPGPNYIDSIQNFPRVYSGVNDISIKATQEFLETIINTKEYPLTLLNGTNATEMAKVLENAYRAMNIAFIVEWSRFAEQANVNLYEVVDAIKQRDTHSNMMFPGIGVGGYCLTKDPLLASWSKQKIFSDEPLIMSENAVKTNDQMPRFAFNFFKNQYSKSLSGKKVLFLGVSYRGDVGDTRFSPVELIYNLFVKENAIVHLHDPILSFWEEKNINIQKSIHELLKIEIDVIVITTGHSYYKSDNMIKLLMNKARLIIYDTIGLLNKEQIKLLQTKHQLFVLGRGDH